MAVLGGAYGRWAAELATNSCARAAVSSGRLALFGGRAASSARAVQGRVRAGEGRLRARAQAEMTQLSGRGSLLLQEKGPEVGK
jgi:hypothetical protein